MASLSVGVAALHDAYVGVADGLPEPRIAVPQAGEFFGGVNENVHGDPEIRQIPESPGPLDERVVGFANDDEVDVRPGIRAASGQGAENVGRLDASGSQGFPQDRDDLLARKVEHARRRPAALQKARLTHGFPPPSPAPWPRPLSGRGRPDRP